MDVGAVLFDILILLVAAKIGAEVSERIGVPAVVGEIVAGIIIGPSIFNLVEGGEILHVLAELGVILLLLQVGMEMDLKELGAVGKAALLVAVVGVVLPFVSGYGVATAFGEETNTALFVGAALVATSVGITARVFGDLRALASVEARTVLGAAVADDVLGLVILTVMVRIVTEGSVSALGVGEVFGVAVVFLVGAVVVGIAIAPPIFDFLQRFGRSSGTLIAVAFAFTLAFAELASLADLAPIIGAFVAGLALGRTRQHERIERDLAPLGHIFIPVFFLQIGIETELSAFAKPEVLGLAAALLVVAFVGKVAAGWAAGRSGGDRLLIGFGMLPRGEVGLIFAGIGLQNGALDENLYAAILIVVLVTTLAAPFLLRKRRMSLVRSRGEVGAGQLEPPPEGWLRIEEGRIELTAEPADDVALHVALQAAALTATARPGRSLLDWFGNLGEGALRWDPEATGELLAVLRHGNGRSWRFLEATGVLDRALPELAEAVRRRRRDPMNLDPAGTLRWDLVERLHDQAVDPATAGEHALLDHEEWLVLAGLVLDITGGGEEGVETARSLVRRLALGPEAEEAIVLLVGESELLDAAVDSHDAYGENKVLQLAAYLRTPERARSLFLLSLAVAEGDDHEQQRMHGLHDLIQSALTSPALAESIEGDLSEVRRAEAKALAPSRAADRIEHAPRPYLLATDPQTIATQAELADALSWREHVRVKVTRGHSAWHWRIDVAAHDREALLASVALALHELGVEIESASIATWGDGVALESFVVKCGTVPLMGELHDAIASRLDDTFVSEPILDAEVTFDEVASPWYTRCRVEAIDGPGLLHSLAVALAAAGAKVHSAEVSTRAGVAVDRFELTDLHGDKLGPAGRSRVVAAIRGGARIPSRRWPRRTREARTQPKHSGRRQETPTP